MVTTNNECVTMNTYCFQQRKQVNKAATGFSWWSHKNFHNCYHITSSLQLGGKLKDCDKTLSTPLIKPNDIELLRQIKCFSFSFNSGVYDLQPSVEL